MRLPSKQVESVDDLAELQTWFSNVITRRLYNEGLNPYGVVKKDIKEESRDYIRSTSQLKHYERMEVYNQQYWYRLLTIMQDEFPILRHLIGIEEFNTLVENYLDAHPSDSHFLNNLQKHFIPFLEENYSFDKEHYLLDAAKYDYAISQSFEVKHIPTLDPEQLTEKQKEQLSELPLNLQSHVFLLELSHDLKSYREEVEFDDAEEIFPDLIEKKNVVLIYRFNNNIHQEYISMLEYELLKSFQHGYSINSAIEYLESKFKEEDFEPLGKWFSEWVSKGLFTRLSS